MLPSCTFNYQVLLILDCNIQSVILIIQESECNSVYGGGNVLHLITNFETNAEIKMNDNLKNSWRYITHVQTFKYYSYSKLVILWAR